jgi:peptidoglycan DL-endopeptidase CwlO
VASIPARSPRRRFRRGLVVAGTTLATSLAVLLPSVPAHAAPSAAELTAQEAKLNQQIEVTIEKYNGITVQLAKDKAALKKITVRVNQASADSLMAQKTVAEIAKTLYMRGKITGLTTIINAQSTSALLNEMSMFDTMARSQGKSIRASLSTLKTYKTQADRLAANIAAQAKAVKDLASVKVEINRQLQKIQDLQRQLGYIVTSTARFDKAYAMPVTCPQVSGSGKGRTAALKACSLLWPKHWYSWGASGPTYYDCSGLTMTAWKAAGINLEHYTGYLYSDGKHGAGQVGQSYRVARSAMKPGDLVFYNGYNHVAIYIGNNWIVQAPHTGDIVKESPIDFEPIKDIRRPNGT